MKQEVKPLKIDDLVLWTENPRDPINENATDEDIISRALEDKRSKWNLSKLAKEMGAYYDLSEIPTVVYKKGKPVVYDGNRRIILGKLKLGYIRFEDFELFDIPDFPELIPCNVCSESIALTNIYRKHAESGSWDPLERDIFRNRFLNETKSPFLTLDDETGIISSNPHLNKRFVQEEIFTAEGLEKLGFKLKNDALLTVHSKSDATQILNDLSLKIYNKTISTRNNRGNIIGVLEPSSRKIIDENKSKKYQHKDLNFEKSYDPSNKKKKTRRVKSKKDLFFGGTLYLRPGIVSNIYRDLTDLYNYYLKNKDNLSDRFPSLIRMGLRLISETAANDVGLHLDKYLKNNFEKAHKKLDKELKATLHTQNIKKDSIVALLHHGAHNYDLSSNIEQTIAISIILGRIIATTHGHDK